ncbi:MAG: thioredoxin domain-containing protein [Acidobacteria bacterium]|nr:thioredoxin domain-containing protein [Acidobacteriota bacterium]
MTNDRSAANRLIHSQSPYLLQHAYNPVDWHPWGEEAFRLARTEDKPLFLSIGYSTCHWCHVMERESFEDSEVARLMNEAFINIKVDREERPDIDNIYMTVCQMLTGSGGWPMTIIMTPDKVPFFAGTYFPRESRFGRPGMLELIPKIQHVWQRQREQVLDAGASILAGLQQAQEHPADEELTETVLAEARRRLGHRYDPRAGGFGPAPKFPTPHNLLFLLRYWHRTGDSDSLAMVTNTLRRMRAGGIYDQLGFGFHRYSTDADWRVPHFEKMLYDQALLALAYLEAFQATGRPEFDRTAREIFDYVQRDLTSAEGTFYSAEDADSEGEEGKFYLWTEAEIRQHLTVGEANDFCRRFNIRPAGNFVDPVKGSKTSENILHIDGQDSDTSNDTAGPDADEPDVCADIRRRLLDIRARRVRPHRDDKILTDWNGLMIAALARGTQVLGNDGFARQAAGAAYFILNELRDDTGRLWHRYRNGDAAVPGLLDDYAFMAWGLLELYEATFATRWLQEALHLSELMLELFWDEKSGGLFFTPTDGETMLVRQKEVYDGAVPSGNSVAMGNFLRLARMTGDEEWARRAGAIGRAFAHQVRSAPMSHAQFMAAFDFGLGPSWEIVIAGDLAEAATRELLNVRRAHYLPRAVTMLHPPVKNAGALRKLAPFLEKMTAPPGQSRVYVCRDYACHRPTADPDELAAMLRQKGFVDHSN